MESWIIHQTDRGDEDERGMLLVTNGYYRLLTVTNGYSGLLGARPGSLKMAERRDIGGAFFGNHPLTSGEGQSGLGRVLQFSAARLQHIPLYNRESRNEIPPFAGKNSF